MLTKEISEVEKEFHMLEKELENWEGKISLEVKDGKFIVTENYEVFTKTVKTDRLKEKLSTLKSAQAKALELEDSLRANKNYIKLLQDKLDNAQAKFDKFVKDLKTYLKNRDRPMEDFRFIDELSSKAKSDDLPSTSLRSVKQEGKEYE